MCRRPEGCGCRTARSASWSRRVASPGRAHAVVDAGQVRIGVEVRCCRRRRQQHLLGCCGEVALLRLRVVPLRRRATPRGLGAPCAGTRRRRRRRGRKVLSSGPVSLASAGAGREIHPAVCQWKAVCTRPAEGGGPAGGLPRPTPQVGGALQRGEGYAGGDVDEGAGMPSVVADGGEGPGPPRGGTHTEETATVAGRAHPAVSVLAGR